MCFKNAAKAAKSAGAVKDMHKKAPQAKRPRKRSRCEQTCSELEAIAVAEFCAVLKGANKTQKVEMFESLAGERKWNPGGGTDPAANPTQQEWVGRAVRKNFEGSVHDQQLFTVIYAGRDGGEEVGLAELMEIAADRAAGPNQSSRRSSRSQGS